MQGPAASTGSTPQSEMSALKTVVAVPFSSTPSTTTGKTWLQGLATASTPELLRTVAIELAVNNYIAYESLRNTQQANLLTAAQAGEVADLTNQVKNVASISQSGSVAVANNIEHLSLQIGKLAQEESRSQQQ